MSEPPPVVLRPAELSDRALVLDSWLQSYKDSEFARRMPPDVYWSRFGHVGLVEDLLERNAVIVACLPTDPSFVYGWACVGTALHYIWVKRDWREFGIGRQLYNRVAVGPLAVTPEPQPLPPLRVTHMTADFSRRLAKGRTIQFVNPYKEQSR